MAYGFTVALVSFGLFVRRAATETGLYRKQALVMGAGVGVPIVAAAVDVVHPLAPIRLTPILFLSTGVLFWWGLTRYRVLELVLLARDLAIEHMSDPVVVLDTDDCLVDYNPAAAALFGLSDGDLGSSPEAVVDPETDSGTLADGEEVVVDAGGRPATSRSTASPSPTAAATPESASTCSTT